MLTRAKLVVASYLLMIAASASGAAAFSFSVPQMPASGRRPWCPPLPARPLVRAGSSSSSAALMASPGLDATLAKQNCDLHAKECEEMRKSFDPALPQGVQRPG